jgi:hypothetical protein
VSHKKKKGYEICNLLQNKKKHKLHQTLSSSKREAQTCKRALGKVGPRRDSIEQGGLKGMI